MPHVSLALTKRYLDQALGSKDNLNWYIAGKLQSTGLFSIPEDPGVLSPADLRAVEAALQQVPPRAFAFLEPAEGESRTVFEVTDTLGSIGAASARTFAPILVDALRRATDAPNVLTAADRYLAAAESQGMPQIIQAAADLEEALLRDWAWQILILSSACSLGIDEAINRQFSRLLNFDLADLATLDYLKQRFDACVEPQPATDLDSNASLNRGGHLPWRVSSIASQVWTNGSPQPNDVRDSVTTWMSLDRPGYWFQAWLTAMHHSDLIPEETWPALWTRIEALAGAGDGVAGSVGHIARRYCRLLNFFFYRLEVLVIDIRSDVALWVASALASDIAVATSSLDTPSIDKACNTAAEEAHWVWQVASPPSAPSDLRGAFLAFQNLWAAALQASPTEWRALTGVAIPQSTLERFAGIVRKGVVLTVEPEGITSARLRDGLLNGLTTLQKEWLSVVPDMEEWFALSDKLKAQFASPDNVTQRLSSPMDDSNDVSGFVALATWSAMVAREQISIDKALELLNSADWLVKVESSFNVHHINRLLSAFLSAPIRERDTQVVGIAHWFARRCLAHLGAPEKRSAYFVATGLVSLRTSTVSALERLLVEDQGNELRTDREGLKTNLRAMQGIAPPWVHGRIRAVLAALSA